MTNIVIINPESFLERKNIKDIPVNLLSKYEFISNVKPVNVVYNKINRNNNFNKKYNILDRPNKKNKTFENKILGILNIVNEANYSKMLNKIRLIKSDENITDIIFEILKISTIQIFYLQIYIKLLRDIFEYSTKTEQDKITLFLNTYFNDFIENRQWKEVRNTETDYNSFCNYKKKQDVMISNNIIINELQKNFNGKFEIDYNNYIQILEKDLVSNINDKKEDVGLIVLEMLFYNIKLHNMYVNINCSDLINKIDNKKFYFLLQDLNEYKEKNKSKRSLSMPIMNA